MFKGQARPFKRLRSYPVEIALGLSLLGALNFILFPQDPGFTNVSPHPYWALILAIAIRYGFWGGLSSGLACCLLFVALKLPKIPDPSLFEIINLDLWGRPLMFLAVGAILGEVRQTQIVRQREVSAERDRYKESYEKLLGQYDALSRAKQEIDTRIISQEHTLSTVYEAAQALRSLNQEEIYPAVLDLLKDYLDVSECAIYMLEDEVLRLKSWLGPDHSPPPEVADKGRGMIGQAFAKNKTVVLSEIVEDMEKGGGPIIAAPIASIQDGRVAGVISISSMPFLKFTPESARMVSLIADWCGTSLENALRYKHTKDKLIADEMIDAYTSEYLKDRLVEEFKRSRRYKIPLSLLFLRFPSFGNISDKNREDLLLTLSLVLKNWTRDIDLLFLHDVPGQFVLLLPNTPLQGAKVVAKNIQTTFRSIYAGMGEQDAALAGLGVGVATFSEDLADPGDMLNSAEKDALSVQHAT
ncbi:MAG: GAF domain-containing protein [Desulfovibrionaceae bacterium]|nr:GAF domain-containing protein [Desulfovibrionaceae bacterium]